nr:hypothetical protein [Candidatus Sigynarchaeota archaeon]
MAEKDWIDRLIGKLPIRAEKLRNREIKVYGSQAQISVPIEYIKNKILYPNKKYAIVFILEDEQPSGIGQIEKEDHQ